MSPILIVLQPTSYCNISCEYCYVRERSDRMLMSREVLIAVGQKIFASLDRTMPPTVIWHAGEPLTAPIKWYNDAYDILEKYAPPETRFALQTNGISIDDDWIDLFRRTNTAVGLSIDGPEKHHDAKRKTKQGKGTWALAVRGLERLQAAGFFPHVITVLSPDSLKHSQAFFEFYKSHSITHVGFNIDEQEGLNSISSFGSNFPKKPIVRFLAELLQLARAANYPLHIREIERITRALVGNREVRNEQVIPWGIIIIGKRGEVSTFSPELLGQPSVQYDNFCFSNIIGEQVDWNSKALIVASSNIAAGVERCRRECDYFSVCGGGAPINKFAELGTFNASETNFCKLTVQASADALRLFLTMPPCAHATAEIM